MAVRTGYTIYYAKETVQGEIPTGASWKKLRTSDFTLEGQTEEITSDVKLPNSRIQAKGDAGTQSSSGNLNTEFYPEEINDFIKASMLSVDDFDEGAVKLGNTQQTFCFIKEYYQGSHKAYQVFCGVQIGQMQLTFEIKAKVGVSFGLVGVDNNPILTDESEGEEATLYTKVAGYCASADKWETKSYNTLKGAILISHAELSKDYSNLVRSVALNINQNPDSTFAVFTKKAIDSSLGDEQIDGSVEIWNTQDNKVVELRNKALEWLDDVNIAITLGEGEDVKYVIGIKASLKTPTESKDGNKLAFNIPIQVYNETEGLVVTKLPKA